MFFQVSESVLDRVRAGLVALERREAIRKDIAAQSPVQVGERRTFYSPAVGSPGDNPRLCHYTGRTVTVVGISWAADMPDFDPEESEPVFTVRADDGTQFDAFAGELDGWYERTGQYVLPDGSYYAPPST